MGIRFQLLNLFPKGVSAGLLQISESYRSGTKRNYRIQNIEAELAKSLKQILTVVLSKQIPLL